MIVELVQDAKNLLELLQRQIPQPFITAAGSRCRGDEREFREGNAETGVCGGAIRVAEMALTAFGCVAEFFAKGVPKNLLLCSRRCGRT